MKVQFVEQVERDKKSKELRRYKQTRVEVVNGEYRRVFERTDEPFEATLEEWEILRATGEFEQFEAEPKQQTEKVEASQGAKAAAGDAKQ